MDSNVHTPAEISSILGVVDTVIRHKEEMGRGNRQYYSYHPSEWGGCLRRQQYKHYVQLGKIEVEEESHGSEKLRLFEKGHNMQSRWEKYFETAEVLRGYWKCTNPFCFETNDDGSVNEEFNRANIGDYPKSRMYGRDELVGCFKPDQCACGNKFFSYHEVSVQSEELNMKGHADIILDFSRFDPKKFKEVRSSFNVDVLPEKPIVVDMKTIGEWSWKNQVMKYGLHKKYMVQILIYTHLLDCEYGVVIYENKNNSKVMAFKVERNDELFNTIIWQAKIMQEMAQRAILPPPSAKDKKDYECRYCEFKPLCHKADIWNDDNFDKKRISFYKQFS